MALIGAIQWPTSPCPFPYNQHIHHHPFPRIKGRPCPRKDLMENRVPRDKGRDNKTITFVRERKERGLRLEPRQARSFAALER